MTACVWVPNDTGACSVGADAVAAAIQAAIHRHGVDARVVRNGSRGAYWLEPLVEVDSEQGRLGFACVQPGDAAALFGNGELPSAQHPSCVGLVEQLPFIREQQRITFRRAGVIEPLNLDAYRSEGGLRGLTRALGMKPAQIVAEIEASGLRGRGGAAFPAGVKWQAALVESAAPKYVVCNADEGDSGTFADRLLMEADPLQLIEGMVIAGLGIGAQQGFIYVRSEYPKAIAVLRAALTVARGAGLLGGSVLGSAHAFDIDVRVGAGAYVCGEETSLLASLEGKRGMVRAKPPLPVEAGLFGKPTLVHNVLTLAATTDILANGGAWYAQFGSGRSRGTMPFQLSGNITCGGIVELPFGVTLRQLVTQFGDGSLTGRPLKALQVGGPLGAYLPEALWDTPLDYEALAAVSGLLGHGGVVAFDDSVQMAEQAEFAMQFCADESCGKCTPCRIGSVRGVEVIRRIRRGEQREANTALLNELCETLEVGSLCALGGLTPMPVLSALRHFPQDWLIAREQAQ